MSCNRLSMQVLCNHVWPPCFLYTYIIILYETRATSISLICVRFCKHSDTALECMLFAFENFWDYFCLGYTVYHKHWCKSLWLHDGHTSRHAHALNMFPPDLLFMKFSIIWSQWACVLHINNVQWIWSVHIGMFAGNWGCGTSCCASSCCTTLYANCCMHISCCNSCRNYVYIWIWQSF